LKQNVKPLTTISAVVLKVDGSKTDLGVISNSEWGRFSIQKWLTDRRIKKLNGN
jgi:hypothetical protein